MLPRGLPSSSLNHVPVAAVVVVVVVVVVTTTPADVADVLTTLPASDVRVPARAVTPHPGAWLESVPKRVTA